MIYLRRALAFLLKLFEFLASWWRVSGFPLTVRLVGYLLFMVLLGQFGLLWEMTPLDRRYPLLFGALVLRLLAKRLFGGTHATQE